MVKSFLQGFALDQLHDEKVPAVERFHSVQGGDVRVIEGGENPGFALEPRDAIPIVGGCVGQDLHRNAATELRIARAIDLTHSAGSERRDDFVEPESRAGGHRHRPTLILPTASYAANNPGNFSARMA